jgi:hypothetical protein
MLPPPPPVPRRPLDTLVGPTDARATIEAPASLACRNEGDDAVERPSFEGETQILTRPSLAELLLE